jgi:hypothetical protein
MAMLAVYRVTVFVPPEALERVIDGILAVDPLRIGDYDRVSWISAPGRERYRPLAGAAPACGTIGTLECGETVRLEFCLPRERDRLERVIADGIRPHHPWRVPAIFVDESELPLP